VLKVPHRVQRVSFSLSSFFFLFPPSCGGTTWILKSQTRTGRHSLETETCLPPLLMPPLGKGLGDMHPLFCCNDEENFFGSASGHRQNRLPWGLTPPFFPFGIFKPERFATPCTCRPPIMRTLRDCGTNVGTGSIVETSGCAAGAFFSPLSSGKARGAARILLWKRANPCRLSFYKLTYPSWYILNVELAEGGVRMEVDS